MAITYYMFSFIITCMLLVLVFFVWDKKVYSQFNNVFWLVAIANGGYYMLAAAETLETAVLAKQICYLGGCFIPVYTFFNITTLCKMKLSKPVKVCLMLWCIALYGCVLTIGVTDIFYVSYEMNQVNGVTILEKVYGPTYYVYIATLLVTNIASLLVVLRSLRSKRRHKVSYINGVLLLIGTVMVTSVYLIQRLVDSVIDWVPLFYVVFLTIFLVVYRRVEMYEINSVIVDTFDEEEVHGYIMLSEKNKYLGSNDMAKKYFPILDKLKLDYRVDSSEPLFKKIKSEAKKLQENASVVWYQTEGEKELKFEMRYLYYKDRKNGYLIEISDDTIQQQYIKLINNYNSELEEAVRSKTEHILDIQNKIILGMANVLESRDNSTGGHIKRTSEVVNIFVKKLIKHNERFGLPTSFYKHVVKGAPMHDIGKIVIDDDILKKPGKYTDGEYEIMKTHSYEGAQLIDSILEGVEDKEFVKIVKNLTHFHHEKYDGSGYPNKLAGENIPMEARIMALADVFDALVSKRCYKEKMSYEQAFKIIKESCGSHFDPVLGEVFLQCRDELVKYYDTVED